jgi:murein DD-endopeptidase MepM/ murein hydrolase activator NlpD
MTLWWANKLKSKDDLHVGQVLRIPPVSGLVVTVSATDTLEALAEKHDVKASRILALNDLEDPTLVVGQVLVIPGAKGAPIPTPKPKPTPERRTTSASNGGGGGGGGARPRTIRYTGGQFRWPVIGGGNYVSQYAHAGHVALDIAGDYGSPIVAAAGGRVVFAGWKSNGGGWQVWINHGGGMYTTYNHMAGVSVGNGQSVGRGQRVGRLGSSGWATGPHLHFEVWLGGAPWSGGYQVNPMRYF